MPQTPTRQMHALLGVFTPCNDFIFAEPSLHSVLLKCLVCIGKRDFNNRNFHAMGSGKRPMPVQTPIAMITPVTAPIHVTSRDFLQYLPASAPKIPKTTAGEKNNIVNPK